MTNSTNGHPACTEPPSTGGYVAGIVLLLIFLLLAIAIIFLQWTGRIQLITQHLPCLQSGTEDQGARPAGRKNSRKDGGGGGDDEAAAATSGQAQSPHYKSPGHCAGVASAAEDVQDIACYDDVPVTREFEECDQVYDSVDQDDDKLPGRLTATNIPPRTLSPSMQPPPALDDSPGLYENREAMKLADPYLPMNTTE